MKLTQRVVVFSIAWFVLWMIGTGGYELWSYFNDIPNDTISHIVVAWTPAHPWIVGAFVLFNGLWAAFWTTVVFHWWGPGNFWWKKPLFIAKKSNDSEDSK